MVAASVLTATNVIDDHLTVEQAAALCSVDQSTIRRWATAGYIGPDGKRTYLRPINPDIPLGRGRRKLYHFLDVAKAERATRDRARR